MHEAESVSYISRLVRGSGSESSAHPKQAVELCQEIGHIHGAQDPIGMHRRQRARQRHCNWWLQSCIASADSLRTKSTKNLFRCLQMVDVLR